METHNLGMNPFTLAFKSPEVEGEYLGEVANRRWPVLIFIFCFDVFCFLFRFVAKWTAASADQCAADGSTVRPFEVLQEMGHQLANMAMLYVLIGLLNKRARKAGNNAARQEEVLLSISMGLAICNLLASLRADNAQDYVYMGYFLICTSTFLKIRWWVGTGLLATPTVAVQLWHSGQPRASSILPPDAVVHIVVAWAVGGLMAYLNDWYRRQMYANARLASAAHDKEMMEATARIQAQRELAAAQAQAAQRALIVAREKAAHEAKSEFMSLMCHEVRTPLNGCLASAEMLLETPLKEEQRELANTIRVSGSILLSTVSNFLDFFKLEAGKRLDIVRSEICLSDLVGDVHCIIEAMIGRAGSVSLQQPQLLGVPDKVFADPDRLRGILLNLYTNAAKFTKRGHIVLRVRCVSRDYTPPAKTGFNAIMLQPTYHPSSSSHRSMDISSCIVMAPALDDSCEQDLGLHAASSAAAAVVVPDSPRRQQKARRRSGPRVSFQDHQHQKQKAQHPSQQEQQGPQVTLEQEPHQQQHQQHSQPLWQQASQWARSFLAAVEADPPGTAAAESAGVHGSNSKAAADHTSTTSSASDSSSSLLGVACKPDSSGGIPKGVQYDVHASTADTASNRQPLLPAALPPPVGSSSGVSSGAGVDPLQQAVPPPTPPAVAPAAASSTSRRRTSSSSDEACWLLFEVEDTGVGITRDGLAMLFREYVQGTEDEMCKPRTRGGTGLGLSICSKQVGVLGGVIGAHSCRGQGSTFWFKIPTYVRQPKSRSTDSCKSQQRQSLEALQQQQPLLPAQQQQQQQAASNGGDLSADVCHDQQQQQQWSLPLMPRPSIDQSARPPIAPVIRAGGGSSSSNVGTYNVIHSGLYHSSQHTRSVDAAAAAADQPAAADHSANAAAAAIAPEVSSSAHRNEGAQHDASSSVAVSHGLLQSAHTHPGRAVSQDQQHVGATCLSAVGAGPNAVAAQQAGSPTTRPPAPATTGAQSAATGAGAVPSGGATPGVTASNAGGSAVLLPCVRQSLSLDGRAPAGPALDTQKLLGKRVLLAEDNLINQTVARKMLSSLGMQVEVAANGLEALNAVQRAAKAATESEGPQCKMFALVLMDMAMPVMGGVESTKAIRAAGFDLPIVAMTANASENDRDECASAGMNGFLSKPVLRDQLARAMLAALEEHEAAVLANGSDHASVDCDVVPGI